MRSLLFNTLSAIEPTYLQGTLAGLEYPPTFFTFWNFDTKEEYYDNKPRKRIYAYWVYCYSDDEEKLTSALRSAIEALRSKGFIVQGETDAASDERTHTGRMVTVYFIESLEV